MTWQDSHDNELKFGDEVLYESGQRNVSDCGFFTGKHGKRFCITPYCFWNSPVKFSIEKDWCLKIQKELEFQI